MGTTATPLYQQIYDDLKAAIKGGTYKNGDRIPSEAELSQSYGVSRITVRRAMEDLCSDGFLVKMQGRGTFVVGTDGRIVYVHQARTAADIVPAADVLSAVRLLAG